MKTANNLLPKFKKLLNDKLDRGIDGTNLIYKIIILIFKRTESIKLIPI